MPIPGARHGAYMLMKVGDNLGKFERLWNMSREGVGMALDQRFPKKTKQGAVDNFINDPALEKVRADIEAEFGKGAIHDPNAPPQQGPLEKPKPQKKLTLQEKLQRNIDAQYGGKSNRMKGFGLGT